MYVSLLAKSNNIFIAWFKLLWNSNVMQKPELVLGIRFREHQWSEHFGGVMFPHYMRGQEVTAACTSKRWLSADWLDISQTKLPWRKAKGRGLTERSWPLLRVPWWVLLHCVSTQFIQTNLRDAIRKCISRILFFFFFAQTFKASGKPSSKLV